MPAVRKPMTERGERVEGTVPSVTSPKKEGP
jgi:hypothetical protein